MPISALTALCNNNVTLTEMNPDFILNYKIQPRFKNLFTDFHIVHKRMPATADGMQICKTQQICYEGD